MKRIALCIAVFAISEVGFSFSWNDLTVSVLWFLILLLFFSVYFSFVYFSFYQPWFTAPLFYATICIIPEEGGSLQSTMEKFSEI